MRIRAYWALVALAILAGAVVPSFAADLSLQYNTDRRVFRVCNLLLPGAYTNYCPFFFLALERSPLKPPGWEFDNPLAPTQVAPAGATAPQFTTAFWTDPAHSPAGGSGATYWTNRGMGPGSPLNKSWPQYWEVELNPTTAPRLRDFDMLYVSAASLDVASAATRRLLMDIVRGGATLWIDSGGSTYTTGVTAFAPPDVPSQATPIPFVFNAVAPSTNYYRGAADPNNLSDLLLTPLRLTPGEVRLLGRYPDATTPCDGCNITAGNGVLDQPLQPILSTWDNSTSTSTTAIAACEYGAGRIIVSAIGVGQDVENWLIAGSQEPNSYQAPDVKFAYNALAWGTQWNASRQASTNTGYTTTSALAPLDLVWQWPSPIGPASDLLGPILASPVVSHGRLYALSLISMAPSGGGAATPATLLCFDAAPATTPSSSPTYAKLWSETLNSIIGGGISDATPHWAGMTACDMPNGIPAILLSAVSESGSTPNGYVVAVNATTGAPIWVTAVPPYPGGVGANPVVRDISTPVVHNGWVYFLTSEFNNSLDGVPGTASPDDTYGRVHCIDLATGGVTASWVYPDQAAGEAPNLLPPFAEPSWVAALPGWNDPSGGPRQVPFDAPMIPIVTPHSRNANDAYTDAVVTAGAPVSMAYYQSAGRIELNRGNLALAFDPAGINPSRAGGIDFGVIPTPPGLNQDYFHFHVQHPIDWTQPVTVARADDPANITTSAPVADPNAPNGIIMPLAIARQFLATPSTAGGIVNPLQLPGGVRVQVTYTPAGATASTKENAWLPGIEPWSVQQPNDERRCTNAAVRGDRLFATTNTPDVGAAPGATAHVIMEDLRDPTREARFSPMNEAPAVFGATQARSETAPAVGHGTAVAATTILGPTVAPGTTLMMPTISALATNMRLRLSLGCYPRQAGYPQVPWPVAPAMPNFGISRGSATTVALLTGGVIADSQYQLSLPGASVDFNWETAGNITAGGGPAGPIYGQPVLVTWKSDNGTPDNPSDDVALGPELYVVPKLARWDVASTWLTPNGATSNMNGVIKLQHYPVEMTSVKITTQDGMPVVGWTAAEPTVTYTDNTTAPATAYPSLIPHGWINLTTARLDANGNGTADATDPPVPVGITLLVSYRGFSDDFGFFNVGSVTAYGQPAWAPTFPAEKVQAPILFGPSASAVSMAGSTIHVGTEGYAYRDINGDGNPDFEAPGGDINDTFASFQWDPATNFVRASTCPVAQRGIFGTPGSIVAATGMPAPTTNGLFTGSRVMSNGKLGLEIGFLSRLRTRETVVVDAGRVLRCVGQDKESELTGTQSWERGQATTAHPASLPLNHPSKVTVLPNGNLLVVDTGNNRVVETDASGNVLWPLDPQGYNYYSSAANPNLHLLRPTDAERYYTNYDIDGDGKPDAVTVTVIADGGNNRVIRVNTWWTFRNGAWVQNHQVQTVTPEFLPDPADPSRRIRAHYTQVELLTNPTDGTLIGYLLAAPNLNQLIVRGYVGSVLTTDPPAAAPIPGAGTYTWSLWSWLYNPPGSTTYNPLSFLGIRNISVRRLDDTVYLDVSCLQYQGQYQTFTTTGKPYYVAAGGTDPGAGVFEWRVDYGTTTPGLIVAAPGGTADYAAPIWRFTQVEYGAVPYFKIPLPSGGTYTKRFVPTSAEILPSGNHLISNYTGVVERFTKAALKDTGVVTSSEVFEVKTTNATDVDPTNDTFVVPYDRVLPDPYGPDWPDPLIAPVYAERVMY